MTTRSPEGEDFLRSALENSRKRHLSPNTCRGDEAVDRLIAQELSASPLLKKSRSKTLPTIGASVDKMQLSTEDFYSYMDKNVTNRLVGLEKDIAATRGTVAENTRKIEEQASLVRKNADSIASLRQEFTQSKAGPQMGSYAAAVSNPPSMSTEDELLYLKARRAARIWPIQGNNVQDLWRNVGIFISNNLGLADIRENAIESVSRPPIPSGPAAKDEVLVIFKETETRDSVMGAASRLAGFVDPNGRPTAGLRMEIPKKLQNVFATLFKYGQMLRRRHGQGTRRHVKFDDINQSLYLNVKLPGDETWSRISTEVARRGLRARESVSDEAIERRMDISGPPNPLQRERAASTSAAAASRPILNPPAWTGRASTSAMDE